MRVAAVGTVLTNITPRVSLQAGIVGEKERAAVAVVQPRDDQRPANGAAELMPIERRPGSLTRFAVGIGDLADEKVARVERVVAHEFERRAMERVGARLRRDRHDAGAAAELRGKDASEHLEFAHLLDRRLDDDGVERVLVVVDAVDQPGVGVRLVPSALKFEAPRGLKVLAPERFSPA